MRGDLPGVMVSSTFYDLREVRQQLAEFIEGELGYRPLISESSRFPIDPDADAIENCRKRVEQNADVMVLVIGSRYGFVHQASGKSVTNLEYLGARTKGIPIYAFIEKRTLTLYEAWHSASGDTRDALVSTIGDRQLFEFIDGVRSTDSVWMIGFEAASDIIASLRVQLAYQMHAGLELLRTLRSNKGQEFLRKLTGKAFRLAVEKPRTWEHRLFAHVLNDEVNAASDLRREYDLGLVVGAGVYVREAELPSWMQLRCDEILRLTGAFDRLVNDTLQKALGPPGVAGDAEEIIFVARQLGRIYREAIEWASVIRRVHPEDSEQREITDALAKCSDDIICKIGSWGVDMAPQIEQALIDVQDAAPGSPQRELNFTLALGRAASDELTEKIKAYYLRKGINFG